MSSIYCRLSYGTLSFRPEFISVPSDTLFQVAGLPPGTACELIIAHPQTLAPLAQASINPDGTCRINTNTAPFRALFDNNKTQRQHVVVQIGNATELLANGLVAASFNLFAFESGIPEAPLPDTRYLTDVDYRDLAALISSATTAFTEADLAQSARIDTLEARLLSVATTKSLTELVERVDALERAPALEEGVIMRLRAFNPQTATVDGLWQQVADLSTCLSALLTSHNRP